MTTVFHRTGRFVYQNSLELVVISVCWVAGSLPVLTAGPATLGAYAVIRSLRGEATDRSLTTILRDHGFIAALLGVVPICVGLVTIGYTHQYVVSGSTLYLGLAILGVYLTSFLWLVVATTLVGLVENRPFEKALGRGYRWTVREPARAALIVLVSGIVVLVGVASIVGLVIIVPAIVFSFHAELVWSRQSATIAA